jgi:hypothetical protein
MRLCLLLLGPVLALVSPLALAQPGEPVDGLPPPPRFSLRGDRLPLSKALEKLASETGLRVEDRRGVGDTPVKVDIRDATPWQALDALAEAAEAVPEITPRGGRLGLVPRPEGYQRPPLSYDGPFRLAVKSVSVSRNLEEQKGTCTLGLELAWLPGVLPLFVETRPQGLAMSDDRLRPVRVEALGSSLAEADGKSSLTFEVPLPALPRRCERIGELKGKLRAIVPTRLATFTFGTLAELAKAAPKDTVRQDKQDGAVCRIDKLTLARDRWSVRVVVQLAPGSHNLETFQANSWPVYNELTLVHTDGKRSLASSSYVLESASARRAILTYHFVDKGPVKRGRPEDWSVRYRSPVKIVEAPIAFRFRDVPLP